MAQLHDAICRVCTNLCAIKVETHEGQAVKVTGNRENPMYQGFTCIKGRSQVEYLRSPDRLLHPLKRMPDGRHERISIEQAMDEVAEKLMRIRDEHGPNAIGAYVSTGILSQMALNYYAMAAFTGQIGTRMFMDPNTLDKGGKQIAQALHGRWMAPAQGFDRPDVALYIGSNPMVSCTGFPAGAPAQWHKDMTGAGMKTIVIDPRRTELAQRSTIHLQATPGHDVELLAAFARVIIEEELYDTTFLAEEVDGLAELRKAVAPFTAERVAQAAGVDPADILAAARIFAAGRRGLVVAGTGPSMSAMGSLVEYLVLCLETLCGHWLRAGEAVPVTPVLGAPVTYRAQAEAPRPWALEPMRVRGLSITTAGVPLSAIADEILMPGPGQFRALLCAGNPAASFPSQAKMEKALLELDLLVQFDVWMSHTAELADYVIVPPMPLEAPDTTIVLEHMTTRGVGYGLGQSYAQYSPAIVAQPEGAELIEQWRFLVGVGERMGYTFSLRDASGNDVPVTFDMSADRVFELYTSGARVSLEAVKAHPGGALFPDPSVAVEPKQPGWEGKLDIGNAEMLRDLAAIEREGIPGAPGDDQFPFRLLCRRERNVYNSTFHHPENMRGRAWNPAFLHPLDMADLDLREGDAVQIESELDAIPAFVSEDATLRRGVVSMSYGFGRGKDRDGMVRSIGSNPNRLIADDGVFDRYTGQPRMSNVPVRLAKAVAAEA